MNIITISYKTFLNFPKKYNTLLSRSQYKWFVILVYNFQLFCFATLKYYYGLYPRSSRLQIQFTPSKNYWVNLLGNMKDQDCYLHLTFKDNNNRIFWLWFWEVIWALSGVINEQVITEQL